MPSSSRRSICTARRAWACVVNAGYVLTLYVAQPIDGSLIGTASRLSPLQAGYVATSRDSAAWLIAPPQPCAVTPARVRIWLTMVFAATRPGPPPPLALRLSQEQQHTRVTEQMDVQGVQLRGVPPPRAGGAAGVLRHVLLR